jgi:hypothetical protein
MKASEMKALTGAKNKWIASSMLCDRIKARKWKYLGDEASFAGHDMRKNLVHFCITKSAGIGCCSHRRIALSMEDAIDCISGYINPNEVTILL